MFLVVSGCGGGGDDTPTDNDNDNPDGNPPVVVQSPDPGPVGEIIPESEQRVIPTDEIKAFVTDSPYAAVLPGCALASTEDPCTLGTLPYLGQQYLTPTVDQVMQRVVVTHDWMGVRLREMLQRMPPDLLPMFAPVTAIIIGSEVRPSAFSVSRGWIRLDPRLLWLSVDEKRTVATNDDPRTNYGSDLQFVSRTRFAIGDDYAWGWWSLTDDSERTLADIEIPLAALLYHELAHANDYVQPDKLADLGDELTPRSTFELLDEFRVSRLLYQQEELTAQRSFLYGLAGVRYFDDAPSDTDRKS
ncbi:MAG: hypothetical protein AAF404_09440, partial [Pseudomonadota bacterium]